MGFQDDFVASVAKKKVQISVGPAKSVPRQDTHTQTHCAIFSQGYRPQKLTGVGEGEGEGGPGGTKKLANKWYLRRERERRAASLWPHTRNVLYAKNTWGQMWTHAGRSKISYMESTFYWKIFCDMSIHFVQLSGWCTDGHLWKLSVKLIMGFWVLSSRFWHSIKRKLPHRDNPFHSDCKKTFSSFFFTF